MKLSRAQLNKIIKESLALLKEAPDDVTYKAHPDKADCDGLWLSSDNLLKMINLLEVEPLASGEKQEERDFALEIINKLYIYSRQIRDPAVKGLCFANDMSDNLTKRDHPCPGEDTVYVDSDDVESDWLKTRYLMTLDWCTACGKTWTGERSSDDAEFNKCVDAAKLKQQVPEPHYELRKDDDDGGGGIYGQIATDDPCFDGRPDDYVMSGRKSFGDWVYKLSKQNKKAKDQYNDGFNPLATKLKERADGGELKMSMISDIEMEVFKVTKKGETGTEADATSKRVGYTFLLKDIKPRKSEEAASWDVHPLSVQVLKYLKSGPGEGATIDCPSGDAMKEGKLNRQQLREFIEKVTGCGC